MTQRSALQQIDVDIHAAMLGADLAFVGVYRGPGVAFTAPGQQVRGYLDRGAEAFGEFGQVVGQRDVMTLLLGTVVPVRGGHVDVDGERFALAEKLDVDESTARFVVREVSSA